MLAVLLICALAAGCGDDRVAVDADLVIATGGAHGVYYSYGTGLADELRDQVRGGDVAVLGTQGSVENLALIEAGQAQLGFSAADAAADEVNAPDGRGADLRAVARLYDDYIHVVVPAQSPIASIADLRGRRVAVGGPGSGVALISGRVLHAAGLTPGGDVSTASLGLDESIDALRAGQIDAFFWSGGLPTSGITSLARTLPIRLLPLADVAESLRRDFGATYRPALVPAQVYPGVAAVSALAVSNYLVASRSAPDDIVAAVARALDRGRARIAESAQIPVTFDARQAIFTAPLPLHEGAARYYRAVKP